MNLKRKMRNRKNSGKRKQVEEVVSKKQASGDRKSLEDVIVNIVNSRKQLDKIVEQKSVGEGGSV